MSRARSRTTDVPARRTGSALTAAVLSLVLALGGCVGARQQTTLEVPTPAPTATPTPTPAPMPMPAPTDTAAEEARAGFYGQQVTWTDCGGGYQCTRVSAPLDWEEPEAGAIEIAVKRLPASGPAERRIGSLLINPGGPGGSGVDRLAGIVDRVIGAGVRAAYDIVSFDPRGVGQSSAVTCGDDAGVTDRFYTYDADIDNRADLDRARIRVYLFGKACLAATGPLLGEVDTVSTAHDLDMLRAVLGDAQLHYLGFSYGTFLGATYAGLYPQNVSRMVLDGALDPSMSLDSLLIGQAVGFENALRAYVTACQAGGSCPLNGGGVDAGLAQVGDLVARIRETPLPAGDGKQLNDMLAFYGIVGNLYSERSWPNLTAALNEAIFRGTGTRLLADANRYLDRTPDGGYTKNANMANTAINCLDYPTMRRDYQGMVAFADRVTAVAPTFGAFFAMGAGCEDWPFEATGARRRITAEGAPPILVIGTTGDPATPYAWSVSLADQLASGVLLTWVGEGHTAYGRAGSCVSGVVEGYLLTGTPPAAGATC